MLLKDDAACFWIIDDTGYRKKGKHSVGVARQYCGQLGKTDNCQVAVSLSLATEAGSLPIGYRLYLPQEWTGIARDGAAPGCPRRSRSCPKGTSPGRRSKPHWRPGSREARCWPTRLW